MTKELRRPYFYCGVFGKVKQINKSINRQIIVNNNNNNDNNENNNNNGNNNNNNNNNSNIFTMDRYYGFFLPIIFIPCLKQQLFKLCLNTFKRTDVSKDLSRLFHNEGPIYNKALKP